MVRADLTVPADVKEALRGCWGVFGVTNFYDSVRAADDSLLYPPLIRYSQKIKDDPGSEEQQGKNLVDAALENAIECFVWSTLPSSKQISGGRLVSRIYEGHSRDYSVDPTS